jgi:hypothetical protein
MRSRGLAQARRGMETLSAARARRELQLREHLRLGRLVGAEGGNVLGVRAGGAGRKAQKQYNQKCVHSPKVIENRLKQHRFSYFLTKSLNI